MKDKSSGDRVVATQPSTPALPAPASAEDLRRAAHQLAEQRGVDVGTALVEQLTALFTMALAVGIDAPAPRGQSVAAAVVQQFIRYIMTGSALAGVQAADVIEAIVAGLVVESAAPPVATLQA